MSDVSLIRGEDGIWFVNGELVFATVPELLKQTGRLLDGQGDVVVDLQGVSRSDSAGLALMLEWLDESRSARRLLQFQHVPQSLLDIARVSNVSALLPLTKARVPTPRMSPTAALD